MIDLRDELARLTVAAETAVEHVVDSQIASTHVDDLRAAAERARRALNALRNDG